LQRGVIPNSRVQQDARGADRSSRKNDLF
jgi:hypothetical protein